MTPNDVLDRLGAIITERYSGPPAVAALRRNLQKLYDDIYAFYEMGPADTFDPAAAAPPGAPALAPSLADVLALLPPGGVLAYEAPAPSEGSDPYERSRETGRLAALSPLTAVLAAVPPGGRVTFDAPNT